MATMTTEQIEQKKQQLKQLAEEAQALTKELMEAGAIELSEEDLDNVAGGVQAGIFTNGGPGEWGKKKTPETPTPRHDYL